MIINYAFFFFFFLKKFFRALYNNVNIKGKTLTNVSLEKCYYDKNYDICLAKNMNCFDEDYKYEPCKDNNNNDNNDDGTDECVEFYEYLKKKEPDSYKKIYSKCIVNDQNKIKEL